ncbi:MAG TPA: hypothetical protein VJN88_09300, partial [Ktedonobacterales bacterium]|nr:hypothetical protein [Ktedonobacterales bacterium]
MSDQFDGQLPDGETSPELAETTRRLATDAALWSARLTSAEGVAQHAREAPYALPRQPTTDAAVAPALYNERNALPTRGHEAMPASRIRAFLAVAAAVVVVALLAILFSTFGKARTQSSTIVGSGGPPNTPSGNRTTYATALPTQSSPYASYVTNIVTANNVDSQDNPVGLANQFYVHQGIFVVMQVRNPPAGTHIIEAVWLIYGSQVTPVGADTVAKTVSGNANVFLMFASPVAGVGLVRILWDPPANDDGSAASDPHLVATVNFTVVAVS